LPGQPEAWVVHGLRLRSQRWTAEVSETPAATDPFADF
jgi:ribosomal protein L30/L7E